MHLENFVPVKVKGFEENYLVNKDSCKVYSKLTNNIIQGFVSEGYVRFRLTRDDNKVKSIPLHRIMIETFKPNKENFKHTTKEDVKNIDLDSLIPNHIDGNKLNNSIENLEWCTRAYNNKEAYRLGLRVVSDKTRKQFIRDCVNEESIKRATENLRRYRLNKKN